jgi:hypothetical protein
VARVAGVGLALGLLLWGPAQAKECAGPFLANAVQARVLQSELMVAGLACDERGRYNAFVKRFEAELVARGHALKRYFHRAHGLTAEQELNRYVTRLANQASAHSIAFGTAYCARVGTLFERVLRLEPKEFESFVATIAWTQDETIPRCVNQASATASE